MVYLENWPLLLLIYQNTKKIRMNVNHFYPQLESFLQKYPLRYGETDAFIRAEYLDICMCICKERMVPCGN